MLMRRLVFPLLVPALLISAACNKKPSPEPSAETQPVATSTAPKPTASAAKPKPKPKPKPAEAPPRKISAKPVASVEVAEGDPHKGQFTLAEATKGLNKGELLVAEVDTEVGTLTCELYEDKAPITVATFVGLARGLRAWKDKGKWVKKPLYDGTVFHRIIKGFMIQGGDPAGNGSGGPGFVIPDEIWEDAHHDTRGQLCMANRGPNTNGSQFFIMDGKAAHLDGGYTIFGKCSPDEVIDKLSNAPVRGDRAIEPPKVRKVTVKRVAAPALAASASGAPSAAAPSAAVPPGAAPPGAAAPSPAAPGAAPVNPKPVVPSPLTPAPKAAVPPPPAVVAPKPVAPQPPATPKPEGAAPPTTPKAPEPAAPPKAVVPPAAPAKPPSPAPTP